jgi:hypothetical protein
VSRRSVHVDLEDILAAMTASGDLEQRYHLDLEDGRVLMLTEETYGGVEEQIEQHPERYPEIPRVEAREQYQWMCRFAEQVEEEDIRDKLNVALAGRGAFGRFRDVVLRYPDLKAQWMEMRQRLLTEEALAWLHGLGVEPRYETRIVAAPATAPKAPVRPRVSLLDLLLLGAPEGKTERIGGSVLRQVSAGSPSEARGLFKVLARDLAAYYGLDWRNRLIEGKNDFDLEQAHLKLCGTRVELWIEVPDEVWRAFD